MMKWQKKVYHLPIPQKLKINSKHWLQLRRTVFKRDKFQCQKCLKFFLENGLQLQAHHIIPRENGGKTTIKNLISLCIPCHDFVELNPQALNESLYICGFKEKSEDSDWHKWVYGGYKKPCR